MPKTKAHQSALNPPRKQTAEPMRKTEGLTLFDNSLFIASTCQVGVYNLK